VHATGSIPAYVPDRNSAIVGLSFSGFAERRSSVKVCGQVREGEDTQGPATVPTLLLSSATEALDGTRNRSVRRFFDG
jgi:hypothetical protein